METIEAILRKHRFFEGVTDDVICTIAGCGKNVQLKAGDFLFHEGGQAESFYLVREGVVALEVMSPSAGPIVVETIHAGEVIGWSWLVPPYQWQFDALVVEPVRLTVLDGKCLRAKCESNPQMGFTLLQRITAILLRRLQSTRLALLEAVELKR